MTALLERSLVECVTLPHRHHLRVIQVSQAISMAGTGLKKHCTMCKTEKYEQKHKMQ
jgi:hypothetical protein